ncbi:hypothetical protein, partial [Agrobacterium vitis]|uniref:hypothetical protein n=1 Tax=Agrobacterium vitis TaxID=373 RepID=UPI001AED953D
MPPASRPHNELVRYSSVSSHPAPRQNYQAAATEKSMGRGRRIQRTAGALNSTFSVNKPPSGVQGQKAGISAKKPVSQRR